MLEYKQNGDTLICCFSGRLDTEATMDIEDELIDKVQHAGGPVVFDFAGLEYVTSSFLRTCVKVVRVDHTKLTVINASDEILHIFEMTGFNKLMDIKQD